MKMNMKAISLLLLRFSTGIYLVFWGIVKLDVQRAAGVSDKYYSGALSGETLSLALGAVQILVGAIVVLGIFRVFAYWAQAVWYLVGILPILAYILDPLALYLVDAPGRLTFFPSTTLLFASIVMIAFKEYDSLSVDHKRGK